MRYTLIMTTTIELAYINYEHGGLPADPARSELCTCTHDFAGLVRMAGEDDRWPDLLVMGEGVNYRDHGGRGMWGAANAMSDAGGPPYVPAPCTLPREWGPYAPVMFYNPITVKVQQFYCDDRDVGWAARVRNVMRLRPRRGGDLLHVATLHGDTSTAEYRLFDAQMLHWMADDRLLSAILADWNETLSGPGYEPPDLDDRRHYGHPWKVHHRLRTQPGLPGRPLAPREFATHAMDYLVGYWDPDEQTWQDGIGFVDACQREGITTPTNLPRPGGPVGKQLLHILLNGPLAERIVPGSTRVHEPLDPAHPDSDHKRISVAIQL